MVNSRGIGVDDVFVIVGALTTLTPDEAAQPVHEKMSLMLRHAGVSITVTSLTDIVAFGIGATTVLVLVITVGVLGVNIWGTINLKQEFDSRWFLPTDSYAYKYFEKNDIYFPNDGISAGVYCGEFYYNDGDQY
ncbi:hypothetical protein KUTeg_016393 [Tegillarca granosa]|uniref:SSD domain-containing protein n=1 Tax=Tegillarca granosa TaxID=220873 RepID=A0ABQ9ERD9_TEGGR|nr:hypothetical protein KUTeg_016393 [Tegillarca granosa]